MDQLDLFQASAVGGERVARVVVSKDQQPLRFGGGRPGPGSGRGGLGDDGGRGRSGFGRVGGGERALDGVGGARRERFGRVKLVDQRMPQHQQNEANDQDED